MGKFAVELNKRVYIDNNILQEYKLQDATDKVQKWVVDFNSFMERMAECIKGKRYVMFEQDVWYDYKTGLLLPQLDKGLCHHYNLDSFSEWLKSVPPEEYSNIPFPFADLHGRLISSDECREIFNSEHPYKNNIEQLIGNYILTSSSLYAYKNPCPNDSRYSKYSMYNGNFRKMYVVSLASEMWCGKDNTNRLLLNVQYALDVGKVFSGFFLNRERTFVDFCDNSNRTVFKEEIVNAEGNVTDAVLILVSILTPMGHDNFFPETSEEIKKLAYVFFHYRLTPLEMSQEDKSNAMYFKDTFSTMEKYVGLDEASIRDTIQSNLNENFSIPQVYELSNEDTFNLVRHFLLSSDTRRANLTPYPVRILTDINMGHWELYEQLNNPPQDAVAVDLEQEVPARPPQLDVRESGICAIDFGTKSTVVVCRNREERLLRVGKTDYRKKPTMEDYENPTAIELRDIRGFLSAYNARDGRPFTEWEQITVSHQALVMLE